MASLSYTNATVYDSILATNANINTVNADSINVNTLNAYDLSCNNLIISSTNNSTSLVGSTINLGTSGSTVNIYGNTATLNTVNTYFTDKAITINKNGTTDTSGSGIVFEENGSIKASILLNPSGDFILDSSNDNLTVTNLTVNGPTTISSNLVLPSTANFNNVLNLNAGTISGVDLNVNSANKTNTYVKFNPTADTTSWAYLRQINTVADKIALSFDFHENADNARFLIRDVSSATPITNLSVLGNKTGINTATQTLDGLTVNGDATLGNDSANHTTTINGPLTLSGNTTFGDAATDLFTMNGAVNFANNITYSANSTINLSANVIKTYTPVFTPTTNDGSKTSSTAGAGLGYYMSFGAAFKVVWGKYPFTIAIKATNPNFSNFTISLPSGILTTIMHCTCFLQSLSTNMTTASLSFNTELNSTSQLGFIICSSIALPTISSLEVSYMVIGY
jgi:hypothetical protein